MPTETFVIELPPDTLNALRADAAAQGQSLETLASQRLAEIYQDNQADAVEAIQQALSDFDNGERGVLLEDYVAEVQQRRSVLTSSVAA